MFDEILNFLEIRITGGNAGQQIHELCDEFFAFLTIWRLDQVGKLRDLFVRTELLARQSLLEIK